MKIYRFDEGVSRAMTVFDSNFRLARIVRTGASTQVGCFYLEAGDVVGYHQATVPQLFLVVAGSGWVRGQEKEPTPIAAGQAAFWQAGEWHESGTGSAMTAIVIEAEGLDPAKFMVEA